MQNCLLRLPGSPLRAKSRPMSDKPPPSRFMPVLVLGGILILGVLAWLLFPTLQGWIAGQDCIATGRTNCH